MTVRLILILLASFLFVGCAKRGSITGGLKDTIPPTFVGSVPENYSTNFKGNVIKLTFDEYVKLKDVNRQLIVSPPMKVAPSVTPSVASKTFTITLKDTLKDDTTYSLNFGQSVQDNNEGNPLSQFRFVFSTGSYVDSLQIGGKIKDAFTKKTDNFVSIMMYEVNDTFTDSTIYKETPRYITNTLDSLTVWKLENLKEGKYLLLAVKDGNNNNKYDPKTDKIAFLPNFITVPNDTIYRLDLFKEEVPFKAMRPSLDAGHKFIVGYEGRPEKVTATIKNGDEVLKSVVTQYPDKDSLNVWFPRIKADSLQVTIRKGDYEKSWYTKIKAQKKDTLTAKTAGSFNYRSDFKIETSTPIENIDASKISLIKRDSSQVAFTTAYDTLNKRISLKFEKEYDQKYKAVFLPGALTDFYEETHDTLSYNFTTKPQTDYGTMRVTLKNVRRFPVIVDITNQKGDLVTSMYSEGETFLDFSGIDPGQYILRLIYDDNKNRRWDAGNYLQKRQPEEVIYYNEEIMVRANWDVDQVFTLP